MSNEKLLHDLIIDQLKHKLGRQYKEIKVNSEGNPDMTLSNHGLTLALLEVETESSINPEKAEKWKTLAQQGTRLILMVPKTAKAKTTETLWEKGIADRVSIGTYEIALYIP